MMLLKTLFYALFIYVFVLCVSVWCPSSVKETLDLWFLSGRLSYPGFETAEYCAQWWRNTKDPCARLLNRNRVFSKPFFFRKNDIIDLIDLCFGFEGSLFCAWKAVKNVGRTGEVAISLDHTVNVVVDHHVPIQNKIASCLMILGCHGVSSTGQSHIYVIQHVACIL